MLSKQFIPGILLLVGIFFSPCPEAALAQTAPMPQAVIPEAHFEFSPVFDGREIRHAFVIQNKGTAPLVIKEVRTD